MKAIHLTACDDPVQSFMMVRVLEPNVPSANQGA